MNFGIDNFFDAVETGYSHAPTPNDKEFKTYLLDNEFAIKRRFALSQNVIPEFIFFQNQGSIIGGVYGSNGGNMVSYNTSSEYRLKTDLKNYNGLDLLFVDLKN